MFVVCTYMHTCIHAYISTYLHPHIHTHTTCWLRAVLRNILYNLILTCDFPSNLLRGLSNEGMSSLRRWSICTRAAPLLWNKGAKCSLINYSTPQSKSVYWPVYVGAHLFRQGRCAPTHLTTHGHGGIQSGARRSAAAVRPFYVHIFIHTCVHIHTQIQNKHTFIRTYKHKHTHTYT